MSFAEAAQRVGGLAEVLRAAGIRRGDLVMTTARTTPPYLLCWLALASLGAVTVPVNPRSAPAELAGLARQTQPRALITDAGLAGLVAAAGVAGLLELGVLDADALLGRGCRGRGRGRAAGRREPGRRGGADPDLGHDRPVQAGHADPPGLRAWRGRASRSGWS